MSLLFNASGDFHPTELLALRPNDFLQGTLTGAAIIGAGTFAETVSPLIKANQMSFLGEELPYCRVLAIALQNIYFKRRLLTDGNIPGGVYDVIAYLPENQLAVELDDSRFWEFWGFVCSCTGYPVLWQVSALDDLSNLYCQRRPTATTPELEFWLSFDQAPEPAARSIATTRR